MITTASAAFAVTIGAVQFVRAEAEHTQVSFGEIFTEIAYPGTTPDQSPVYAERDGERLQADVYLPEPGSGPTPAVVLAHAGGFHTFDKSDLRGTGRWLADHGVAAIAVDYRLARDDRPTWDKAPQDLVTALRWTQDQAALLNIDADRISLGGMSAGGTLAMNAAWRLQNGTMEVTNGRLPRPPHSVVGFYPGIDVTDMWERDVTGSRRAAQRFTGGTPEQHPDRYRATSPLLEVTTGLQPTLLVVGDRDRSATPESIDILADALREHGVDTTVGKLPFAEHAFDDAYGSLTSQTSRQILLDFLT